MNTLKDFPKDFVGAFEPSFRFLDYVPVRYLEDDQPFMKKYWCFFFIVPAVIIHLTALLVYIAVCVTKDDMMQVAYLLPVFLVPFHGALRGIIIVPKTPQISELIRELGTHWRKKFTKSQYKKKSTLLRRLRIINYGIFWLTVCGTINYISLPLLETLFRRYILHQDCDLLLPFPSSYPFDTTKNWLIYMLVYVFQFKTAAILIAVYRGCELLTITLCALLGAEFLMLKDDFAEVKPTSNRNRDCSNIEADYELTLRDVVIRHQILIKLSRQLDNIFNQMVFIDLLFVGITTCAFCFAGQFSRGPTYMLNYYLAVVTSMLTNVCLCYYGELLTGASARVGDLAYETLWYNGGKDYKAAIWLIIKISQSPCCLTSMRYTVVSLNLFTKVVSTTWSYFTLMNGVYSDKN